MSEKEGLPRKVHYKNTYLIMDHPSMYRAIHGKPLKKDFLVSAEALLK